MNETIPVQPPAGYHYVLQPNQAVGTNAMAVASFVFGLLWFFWLGSLLALVCGYEAKKQIADTGQRGAGLARGGIALGWVGMAAIVLLIVAARLTR